MSSRSQPDLLSLLSSPPSLSPRLPRLLTFPSSSPPTAHRRIIVTNHLPLIPRRLPSGDLSFSWDPHSLPFQFRSGLPSSSSIVHVGILPADIPPADQDRVSLHLSKHFNCIPVFLPADVHRDFYHGFCKRYLWPLLHYLLPLSGIRFDRRKWQAYLSANKMFADRITEILSPDDDFVWAHDYHLLLLPTFLRRRFPRVKMGFFFHSPFPSSEIFRALPVRGEILRALLNADLVGFHTFDYARHFLSCCSRILGLGHESKRGHIRLDYFGRIVTVKILHIGVDMGRLESTIGLPETAAKVRDLMSEFKDRILLLGRDDMDVFKGISFKLLAMERLLEEHLDLRGKVVLVQIANPARSEGKDVRDMEEEVCSIAKRVNAKFGFDGYSPILLLDGGSMEMYEKIAYYAVAECCVVNPVRDGMNLVPYEYTVCRQGSMALEDAGVPKKSVIVVSEFIGSSPSLSGAIRVNPWNIESMADAMYLAISMPEAEKKMRHEKHYKYVSSHDIAYWARSFDMDLEKSCEDHYMKRCWGIGFGLNFRVVALGPNFRKLSVEHIVPAYRRMNRRLILLDYDGTMMPNSSIVKTPSKEVVDILNDLCSDEKNVVFLVSGRGRDSLSKWFDGCQKLGISAEHGYFTRWSRDLPWESCQLASEFEWKRIAEPVMSLYTETTDGSYIELKETAIVWHHQDADPDFGSCQAKELLDHLENVLANEPVVVKRGQHIVEVKPQGISKGIVAKNLISTMLNSGKPPDFILCIGDDRSDEDMFETIMDSSEQKSSLPAISEVFACTVGTKPSKAKYYLDDTVEVIKLLRGLTAPSSLPPKRPLLLQLPFEGSLTLDEL